jgi:hypothetical protein
MHNDKIYYINIKPYIHDLEFNVMIKRFLDNSELSNEIENTNYFKEFILSFLKKYNYIYELKRQETQNLDKIVSKKMLHHLHIFFQMKPNSSNPNKTYKYIKKNKIHKNKTAKKKHN